MAEDRKAKMVDRDTDSLFSALNWQLRNLGVCVFRLIAICGGASEFTLNSSIM
jgi:hypothetical protein